MNTASSATARSRSDVGKAGLRVDSLAALLRGGDTRPAVIPGKPNESLLIDAINYGDVYQMPPDGKLRKDEIAALTRWVKMGVPWPGTQGVRPSHGGNEEYPYTDEDRNFWAFQPPTMPSVPMVENSDWVKSPIDSFVLTTLEEAGLRPAPRADRRTLIRRATYDLHGLPPTAEEIDAFLDDDSASAFERVIERLLKSPRYGERWGRHWLDVARYADSNGGDQNRVHAHAYRYRDYVIDAFNDDLPYDRFVMEQLAGDLLPADNRDQRNRLWTATTFLALGPKPLLKNDDALTEMDVVDEQIQTVSSAFMGLTLGCCRCHDHKFDPFPLADYYALAGIFKSTQTIEKYEMRTHRSWTERAIGADADEARHRELKAEFDKFNDMRRLSERGEGYETFQKMADEIRLKLAKIPVTIAVRDGDVADCALHLRGNPQTLGDPVPRRFPFILAGFEQPVISDRHSGRLELARWLASEAHPLTSRVMANRLWRWHFGEGIVRSTDNFGRLGQRPDNQPLLDWLAVKFVKERWSVREMHRLIMRSATYQMSSHYDAEAAKKDPQNRRLWRFRPRRLSAEEIRDAMLVVSGSLDERQGGPALPAELNYLLADQKRKARPAIESAYVNNRRSVYLPVIRSGLFDLYKVFDFANSATVSGSRGTTTVAPQALFMMNSKLMWDLSDQAALRFMKSVDGRTSRVSQLYVSALGRPPSASESAKATAFLNAYASKSSERKAWQALCRVVLSSNEFVYLQ